MNTHVLTTIDSAATTVIVIAPPCVFSEQLESAIRAVHLHVERFSPEELPRRMVQEKVRSLFRSAYVCLWIDVPIFVPQRAKGDINERALQIMKNELTAPLHIITFDAVYSRKNGREGSQPTSASSELISVATKAFQSAVVFNYMHVMYPYDGGVSITLRYILEKIGQSTTNPLGGEWSPLWYSDVISHIVSSLYDLQLSGGCFTGKVQIPTEVFESQLRSSSHSRALSGPLHDFPFVFPQGTPIGEVGMHTIIEEISLVVPHPSDTPVLQKEIVKTVFAQKKHSPKIQKRRRISRKIGRTLAVAAIVAICFYVATGIIFFAQLSYIRSQMTAWSQSSQSGQWSVRTVNALARRVQILERVATHVPFPYELVGITLPREGVVAGLRSVLQFTSGIQSYQLATEQLGKAFGHSEVSTAEMNTNLDESYKDLSAIQADISQGNPIFDSLFGIDGLSTQLVASTASLRESVTQEKAFVSLIESLREKPVSNLLLVSMDSSSSRPLFGIPVEVSVLTFDHGGLQTSKTYTVSELDSMLKGKVEAPQEMQKYVATANWNLSDGAWSVDGPTAARQIAWFISKQLHVDADTILFVDSNSIASLQASVLNENATKNTEVLGLQSPSTALSSILTSLQAKTDIRGEAVLPVILDALNNSNAILFSRDPGMSKASKALAWDGSVRTPNCPAAFSVEKNCEVLTRFVSEYDSIDTSGTQVGTQKDNQVHQIHISTDALTHLDLISYPQSKNLNEKKILTYLVDASATNLEVFINGNPVSTGDLTQSTQFDKTTLTFPVILSNEAATQVRVHYLTPPIATSKSSMVFFAQKQPGKASDPFSLEISYSKEFFPSEIAPKGIVSRAGISFTTSLTTSKIFAIGF